ncbi:GntR family transcriptional regulator [Labrys neptuniae]|uniref:GntR family transcriptional regulator n=1 Tax=Labrys neptuniae TaxID=376174 RepID=UPI002891AE89|nr:GntR family transcriptional regulator [Labrys neptuniae]MDT3381923.1 GntR family transcriptional regulator [Labrys neptuniae]
MPRPRNVSMKATNLALDIMAKLKPGAQLPPEAVLAREIGVSRTAMRSALEGLEQAGLIRRDGRHALLHRLPAASDYFGLAETESRSDLVERRFLEMAVAGDLMPGRNFSEAELARTFGASTVSVREFLIGFSRYGLVEKAPRGGWRLCAFDAPFARELAATRRTFEIEAIRLFTQRSSDDPVWREIGRLIETHEAMSRGGDEVIRQFPQLDRRFHRFLVDQLNNRFVTSFYDVVSFVFHYHYQWRKDDEIERYRTALAEHLGILRALKAGIIEDAQMRLEEHLQTSVRTLLESAIGAGQERAG